MQPFDICELAREIIITSEQRLEAKNLDVVFDADNDNMFVNADRDAIHQILYNICDNAIKFSNDGGRYEIGIHEKSGKVTVSVYNEGVGITAEDLPYVFDRFYKSDKSRGLDKTGVGLGLYIARTIIEAHKEKIWVESEYGKGSVFSIIFPQKVAMWLPIGTFQQSKEMAEPKRHKREKNVGRLEAPDVRILVVDDTPSNLMIIQGLLKRTKIKVDLAKSGRDALRMIDKKQYQIIFLDHMMPEMDGIETFHAIKGRKDNPNAAVPIIALTANAILGAKKDYLEAGFTDYLSKPVDGETLEKMIMKYLPEGMYTIQY